jgi:MarR family transcriptional regulator, 2-MHQ and catechol-resistance regulon repressor
MEKDSIQCSNSAMSNLQPVSPVDHANFLPLMQELVSTYETFYRSSDVQVAKFGLTADQFDVIATLGNTPGMKIRQLQEKTLIVHPSLPTIIEELAQAGLVEKELLPNQPLISMTVKLTSQGEQLFAKSFPAQVEYLQSIFSQLESSEIQLLKVFLGRLKRTFQENET